MTWSLERLGDDVRTELRRFGPAAGMAEVVAAWPAAVGDEIARNAWPARISRDGTLHVHATSSAWAFELGQLAPTIFARLLEALGDEAPAALRFVAGNVPETAPAEAATGARQPAEPGPHERAAAAELTSAIEDEQLREVIARAVAASLAKSS
jgi:predicted nucleic acid-binding Zn ribbon protein